MTVSAHVVIEWIDPFFRLAAHLFYDLSAMRSNVHRNQFVERVCIRLVPPPLAMGPTTRTGCEALGPIRDRKHAFISIGLQQ